MANFREAHRRRSFRGDVMAVTRRDVTPDTLAAIDRFVRGVS